MNVQNEENLPIDYYDLFYVEAIMQDSSLLQIYKIKPIFEKITCEEFISLTEKVLNSNDYEMSQQFIYFLMLFRDMKHLQEYLNSSEINIEFLERILIFTFGYCTFYDNITERIIDEILYFLSNERLLELVLNSNVIERDKLLLFFILSKFDTDMLNKYFAQIRNIDEFIKYFLHLPEGILRSIIARNYHLFQYIMLLISEGDTPQNLSGNFYNKYREDIEQFSKLSDIVRKYKHYVNNAKEKNIAFNKRDMSRTSYLVNMIKDLPDVKKAVKYFSGEGIFIDEMEEKLVLAIVTDPMLKNVFKHYDSMFEIDKLK